MIETSSDLSRKEKKWLPNRSSGTSHVYRVDKYLNGFSSSGVNLHSWARAIPTHSKPYDYLGR